ncbi:MAG: dUTP diphosphatase, partial [Halieaceae bacterium]|nr:dUTP diphosphatase [Halieaceae bacterium]
MLQMQHRMNNRVHADWISQRFEWYRAVWIECAELMDHVGYKWWKKQTPEWEQ